MGIHKINYRSRPSRAGPYSLYYAVGPSLKSKTPPMQSYAGQEYYMPCNKEKDI